MEKCTKPDSEIFSLLQPELLTEAELRDILINRCVSRNLVNCNKSDLVDLFRNVALPLPQREYTGTSWREKKFMKKQQKTKRSISISLNDSSFSQSGPERKVPRLSSDASSSDARRLKPPPDLINFEKKVIKLSDSSKCESKSSLDKIVIKSKSKESSSSTKSKESSSDSSKSKESSDSSKSKESLGSCKSLKSTDGTKANGKQISPRAEKSSPDFKLKRNSDTTKDDKQKETRVEDSSKKKRQKIVISW